MTIEEVKEEYGYNADDMCKNICGMCDGNDYYCPSDCEPLAWIRKNYDKAIKRLANLDGDIAEMCRRIKTYKWK